MNDEIVKLVEEFKDGNEEPLDGDAVDKLVHIIWCKINLLEGNITEDEYKRLLDRPYFSTIFLDKCDKCDSNKIIKGYALCDECAKKLDN